MQAINRYWHIFSQWRYAVVVVFSLAFLLHLGTTITGGLYADDYIHQSYFIGSPVLEEMGFLKGIAIGDLSSLLGNQFNFFDPSLDNYNAMKEFGVLPWWSSEGAMLHFFRPLATLTHYIDYQLWPDNTHLMHAVNLFWYMLALVVIYAVYRSFHVPAPVALFALLLVVLDHSVFQVVTWIASRSMLMVMAFGFFSVYAYHKSMQSKGWYGIGLLALCLAALSAEAVVAICAYLGAYMLVMDERPWLKRILHMLPFAVLILLWHKHYVSQGFGAFGVDFYIDPGHEGSAFFQAAIYRLPGNFFELITGVDVMSGQVRPDLHQILFALLGLFVFSGISVLIFPQLKQDRSLRFFYCAALLSLVPGLTIALSPRVLVIPFVGMAVVLATVVLDKARKENTTVRRVCSHFVWFYVLGVHVLLSLVLAASVFISSVVAVPPAKPYGYVDLGVDIESDKTLVVINAYRPFWLAFLPHYRLAVDESLPASMRVLGSAFYPMNVTRLAEHQILIEGLPAIQLDAETIVTQPEHAHFAYLMQTLMGLIRSSRDVWQVGERYPYEDMEIQVQSLFKGKPQKILITLLRSDVRSYQWSYWDMSSSSYRLFPLPKVGESVRIEGIFSDKFLE